MANMSYSRFENTSVDLRDCYEAMDDGDLTEGEKKARMRLIKLCVRIAEEFGDELEQD